MKEYKLGQKWISSAEPELGIGRVLEVQHRLVTIHFDLVEETRSYAKDKAPLSRVRFNVGDKITTLDGIEITVEKVIDRDGTLVYEGEYLGTDTAIIETDLNPNITFSKPEERLFTNQYDTNRWFNLRQKSLAHRTRLDSAPIRGLLGPRVALIPHQFYIAQEVASRYAPRVLLADEVGLGKTIEAGLIIHQQLITGRATRVLIVVPPALSFQWFVEMIRRFNLQFALLDEERCLEIEADNRAEFEDDKPELDNPFEAQQLMLCTTSLFTDNPKRLDQALLADWDLVIVDEAHHLAWTAGEPSPEYQVVERLGEKSKGLLLLTATPEQLGRLGHFSRLRLLDPSRYRDYDQFLAEEADYNKIAQLISAFVIENNTATNAALRDRLGQFAPDADDELITALLDRHGTGRVLFRNVRESVSGFPARILHRHELSGQFPKTNASNWNNKDPRVGWIEALLANSNDKFLVICSLAETALALEKYLRDRTTTRSAAFHQGMDLIARDRAANYFADTEKGAQVLVCSEIGSEGRNFQFAHQLVMYDLPTSPDLLEQRIGRLDRIGQESDVSIHVPYSKGSEQERLLNIYDQGLGLFTQPNPAAQVVFNELEVENPDAVQTAKSMSDKQLEEMRGGKDKLLELNSHRSPISEQTLSLVLAEDNSDALEDYMEESFELFGLESEPLNETTLLVKPTEGMVRHSPVSLETQDRFQYPELPEDGLSYTYDRDTALARENVNFLTWENPLVEQAMDAVLSDVTGNCTVIVINLKDIPKGTLLVETLHLVDCIAPAELNPSRYLPAHILRSLISPDLTDLSAKVPFNRFDETLDIAPEALSKIITQQEPGIRKILQGAEVNAAEKFEPIRKRALVSMTNQFQREIDRMVALAEHNPNVRTDEIEFLNTGLETLTIAIQSSQIRLEAVRVILVA